MKAFQHYIDLVDPNGAVIGRVTRPALAFPPGFHLQISEEEFQRRCREEWDGQTLDEVWNDIRNGRA